MKRETPAHLFVILRFRIEDIQQEVVQELRWYQ